MRWTVAWLPVAEADLARLWTTAPSHLRDKITSVVDEIERQLRLHPYRIGDLQPGGYREVIALPVALAFQIIEADCLVRIIAFHAELPNETP